MSTFEDILVKIWGDILFVGAVAAVSFVITAWSYWKTQYYLSIDERTDGLGGGFTRFVFHKFALWTWRSVSIVSLFIFLGLLYRVGTILDPTFSLQNLIPP
jgi:hypothetical protein